MRVRALINLTEFLLSERRQNKIDLIFVLLLTFFIFTTFQNRTYINMCNKKRTYNFSIFYLTTSEKSKVNKGTIDK